MSVVHLDLCRQEGCLPQGGTIHDVRACRASAKLAGAQVRDWHPERSGSRSGLFRCERNGATVFPGESRPGAEALSEAER
jgi:hypothetical protein